MLEVCSPELFHLSMEASSSDMELIEVGVKGMVAKRGHSVIFPPEYESWPKQQRRCKLKAREFSIGTVMKPGDSCTMVGAKQRAGCMVSHGGEK